MSQQNGSLFDEADNKELAFCFRELSLVQRSIDLRETDKLYCRIIGVTYMFSVRQEDQP